MEYAKLVVRDGRIDKSERHEISRRLADPEWAKGFNTQFTREIARMDPKRRSEVLEEYSLAAGTRHFRKGQTVLTEVQKKERTLKRATQTTRYMPTVYKNAPNRKLMWEPKQEHIGTTIKNLTLTKIIPRGNNVYSVWR